MNRADENKLKVVAEYIALKCLINKASINIIVINIYAKKMIKQ